jgi:hypothetical protein
LCHIYRLLAYFASDSPFPQVRLQFSSFACQRGRFSEGSSVTKEDLVLQEMFYINPPPVIAFSGDCAWQMPTDIEFVPMPSGIWCRRTLTGRKVHGGQQSSTLRQRKECHSDLGAATIGHPAPSPSLCPYVHDYDSFALPRHRVFYGPLLHMPLSSVAFVFRVRFADSRTGC